jgi:integrase
MLDLGTDPTGKRRRKKITGRTKAEVLAAMAKARGEAENGPLAAARDTVGKLLGDFLDHGLPGTTRTVNTREWYATMINQHLVPGLGARKLKDLNVDDLDRFLRDRAKAGLSKSTLSHLRGILSRALKWGIRRGRLSRNVAELVDVPDAPRKVSKAMNAVQAGALLREAVGDRHYAYYALGITVPSRPGELLGLAWSCVDFEHGVIHFRQSLKPATKDRPMELGELKTVQSRRSVEVPEFVMDALRDLRNAQKRERLAAGELWHRDAIEVRSSGLDPDLVFRTEVGTAVDYSNQRRALRRLAAKAGLGDQWNPRELRHTAISVLSHEGSLSLEQIADAAGHRNSVITATVYRHNLNLEITSTRGVMERLFGQDRQSG